MNRREILEKIVSQGNCNGIGCYTNCEREKVFSSEDGRCFGESSYVEAAERELLKINSLEFVQRMTEPNHQLNADIKAWEKETAMEETKITMEDKYQTRDGKEVRIFALDGGGDFPVIGATACGNYWNACQWTAEGKYYRSGNVEERDLIKVKQKRSQTVWINVYPTRIHWTLYLNKEDADHFAKPERIDCQEHIIFWEV